MKHLTRKRSWLLFFLVVTAMALAHAYWQLNRLQRGMLFTFPLTGEKLPSSFELLDAKQTAKTLLRPAMISIMVVGSVGWFLIPRWRLQQLRPSRTWVVLAVLVVFAALFDLFTTIRFFHAQGIHLELHPGIRLFGYAYGRTTGPVLGKTLQVVGVLFLSRLMGRTGALLLAVVAVIYVAAGAYNSFQA